MRQYLHTIISFALQHLFLEKSKILHSFGNKVREFRRLKGLSQEELSFRADLHRTYIGMIERGEKNITLINIEKLAMALEIPLSKLFANE